MPSDVYVQAFLEQQMRMMLFHVSISVNTNEKEKPNWTDTSAVGKGVQTFLHLAVLLRSFQVSPESDLHLL